MAVEIKPSAVTFEEHTVSVALLVAESELMTKTPAVAIDQTAADDLQTDLGLTLEYAAAELR